MFLVERDLGQQGMKGLELRGRGGEAGLSNRRERGREGIGRHLDLPLQLLGRCHVLQGGSYQGALLARAGGVEQCAGHAIC